jgi:hypothetical protein
MAILPPFRQSGLDLLWTCPDVNALHASSYRFSIRHGSWGAASRQNRPARAGDVAPNNAHDALSENRLHQCGVTSRALAPESLHGRRSARFPPNLRAAAGCLAVCAISVNPQVGAQGRGRLLHGRNACGHRSRTSTTGALELRRYWSSRLTQRRRLCVRHVRGRRLGHELFHLKKPWVAGR